MARLGVVYEDNSMQRDAVQITAQSQQSKATAETILNNVQKDKTVQRLRDTYNNYLAELNRQMESTKRNIAYNFLQNVVSFGTKIYGLVQDQQTQQVNADTTTFLTEFQGKLNESIINGTSKYIEDENGNLIFQLDPNLQQEYDNYAASIEASDYMSPVKKSALASLQSNFAGIKLNASTAALEQVYNDRNELFNANLNNALISDAQLLVSGNGELPEGAVFSGVAQILARSDWSQDKKDAAIASYMPQVMNQYAIEAGSSIARSQGTLAAQEFIWSVPGLSEDQRQSALAYANSSLSARMSGLANSAVTMMEDAISEGASPADVYKTVLDNMGSEASETRSYVYDQMLSAQMKAVTEIATNQYNQDLNGGLEELQKTYDAYKAGSYDYLFTELPELEKSFVSMYETAISDKTSSLASALNATSKDIKAADQSLLSTLDNTESFLMAGIDANTITPADAIEQYGNLASQIAGQLQVPGNSLALETSKIEFLTKLADNYLPANWKTPINDALDSVYAALQINGSASSLTDEQITAKNKVTQYSYGLIADMFYNNANYTLDDALAEIQNLKESYLMSGISGNYTGLSVPDAADGKPVAKNTSAAISLFNSYRNFSGLVYSDDAAAMVQNEVTGVPAAPQYKFISSDVEKNFNNGSQALMPIIANFTGTDISSITYAPESLPDGSMVACPVYYAGGNAYRIRGEQIQAHVNGVWTHAGYVVDNQDQLRSQGKEFRSRFDFSFGSNNWNKQHDPETKIISQDKSVSSSREFKGITKDPFSQMMHADISVFDGIETKEDAIKHRDEILDVYNSPALRYEMDNFIREIWGK